MAHNARFLKLGEKCNIIQPASAGGSQQTIAQNLDVSKPLPAAKEPELPTGETFFNRYNFALAPAGFVIKPGQVLTHSDGNTYRLINVEDWHISLYWILAERETHD